MKAKNFTGFIFARGGSKGVKDKNIKLLAGFPLISYSIKCGLKSNYIKDIIVSTDSKKIAAISERYGAKIIKRPKSLAKDNSPEIDSWRHAIQNLNKNKSLIFKDLFISLPATSPLRQPKDVDKGIEAFLKQKVDLLIGVSPSNRNPYFNMVKIKNDLATLVCDGINGSRRQDFPHVFDMTTFLYIAKTDYILNCNNIMDGKVGYIIIPNERSLDIDNPFDFHLAELLIKNPFKP